MYICSPSHRIGARVRDATRRIRRKNCAQMFLPEPTEQTQPNSLHMPKTINLSINLRVRRLGRRLRVARVKNFARCRGPTDRPRCPQHRGILFTRIDSLYTCFFFLFVLGYSAHLDNQFQTLVLCSTSITIERFNMFVLAVAGNQSNRSTTPRITNVRKRQNTSLLCEETKNRFADNLACASSPDITNFFLISPLIPKNTRKGERDIFVFLHAGYFLRVNFLLLRHRYLFRVMLHEFKSHIFHR